jgi:hypothetical protein
MAEHITELVFNNETLDFIRESREEIVRCRDCRWYEDGTCYQPDGDGGLLYWEREPDGFCAWGEKAVD